MNNMKNQHVLALDTVNDDVVTDRKTPQGGAQIVITTPTDPRMTGQEERSDV
jgi:hypothetical protein